MPHALPRLDESGAPGLHEGRLGVGRILWAGEPAIHLIYWNEYAVTKGAGWIRRNDK